MRNNSMSCARQDLSLFIVANFQSKAQFICVIRNALSHYPIYKFFTVRIFLDYLSNSIECELYAFFKHGHGDTLIDEIIYLDSAHNIFKNGVEEIIYILKKGLKGSNT